MDERAVVDIGDDGTHCSVQVMTARMTVTEPWSYTERKKQRVPPDRRPDSNGAAC